MQCQEFIDNRERSICCMLMTAEIQRSRRSWNLLREQLVEEDIKLELQE
jgi:hypothetical protein